MNSQLERYRPLWEHLHQGWLKRWLFLILGGVALFSCRQQGEAPLVVTQVTMVEGQEVIVTRVVRQTVQVQATPVATESPSPVELDISFSGTFSRLDPQVVEDENAIDIIENIFVGLTRFNHQAVTIEPALATEWQVSDDGLTWTFHLRDDIFWVQAVATETALGSIRGMAVEPLRPVVAGDVVYAIQRACDPRTRTPDVFILFIIEGCEAVHGLAPEAVTPEALAIVGARAANDTTLEVRLQQPAAYFLAITTMWPLRPVPADVVAALAAGEEAWDSPENIVTSGPFVLSPRSSSGARTVLHRNPYWPLPFHGNVEVVNVFHLESETDAYLLWQDRNLDLSPVPLAEQTNIVNQYASRLDLAPTQAVFYLAYNFDSPVFSVPAVRRAFGAAIDRERLVREVQGGRALPMRHFAPPGVIGAPPVGEVGAGYFPDHARAQMATSGFADCRLMPPVTYLVSSSDLALQQAELLREMWNEELGCLEEQIIVEQVQFGTLLAHTRPDAGAVRPDMWDLGWASYYPDENNWVGEVLHCQDSENRQRRPCSQVDDLIRSVAANHNLGERWELYRQIERLFFAEDGIEPFTPLYAPANYVLRHPWLVYTPALFGGEQYDTYYIDPEIKELERSR
ncbi:MAG: peptide ABC transporter substrate-binding protein [Chloroflexi bacterium]|nr:peptide ABC transporter substrate-binding protein [Chloroflexota bacterium]